MRYDVCHLQCLPILDARIKHLREQCPAHKHKDGHHSHYQCAGKCPIDKYFGVVFTHLNGFINVKQRMENPKPNASLENQLKKKDI